MTNAEMDTLWHRALRESVEAGEDFTRYRFAAMVEKATAQRCAEIIEGQGAIGGQREALANAIRAEYPEEIE